MTFLLFSICAPGEGADASAENNNAAYQSSFITKIWAGSKSAGDYNRPRYRGCELIYISLKITASDEAEIRHLWTRAKSSDSLA